MRDSDKIEVLTRTFAITRRAALIGLTAKAERRIGGGFVFESQNTGHGIRDQALRGSGNVVKSPVVIVGGGIGGLSAAWWLRRNRFNDFVLLEMERDPGGNSRSGRNEISAYPWAAHYVPVPNKESTLVRELFTELGLLQDGEWDERWLCHSPQERLYIHGRWQDAIEPEVGLSAEDHRQFKTFSQRIAEFRASGEFTIPAAPKPSALDQFNFRNWLTREKLTSPYLHWLAD